MDCTGSGTSSGMTGGGTPLAVMRYLLWRLRMQSPGRRTRFWGRLSPCATGDRRSNGEVVDGSHPLSVASTLHEQDLSVLHELRGGRGVGLQNTPFPA